MVLLKLLFCHPYTIRVEAHTNNWAMPKSLAHTIEMFKSLAPQKLWWHHFMSFFDANVVALYILYSDLRPQSRWKSRDYHRNSRWSKVNLPFGWTRVNLAFYVEYGTRKDYYCVQQLYLGDSRLRVNAFNAWVKAIIDKSSCLLKGECKIILLFKSQSKYLADQHFDRGRRLEYRMYQSVTPLLTLGLGRPI